MRFGMRLRELWEQRVGLLLSLAVAVLAALWGVGKISLFPPRVEARPLETAAASTRVLVDTPKSVVLDLTGAVDIESITARALLVGNLINSAPVREAIARRVGIPAERLEIAAPLTRDWPRAIKQAGTERRTSDILKSPDQYRINVRVNPTVPVLEISTQAPTAEAAENLANGAVLGVGDYLSEMGSRQGISPEQQIHLEQLGRAKGGVINDGVSIQIAGLFFMLALAASCFTVLLVSRIRHGWDAQRRLAA